MKLRSVCVHPSYVRWSGMRTPHEQSRRLGTMRQILRWTGPLHAVTVTYRYTPLYPTARYAAAWQILEWIRPAAGQEVHTLDIVTIAQPNGDSTRRPHSDRRGAQCRLAPARCSRPRAVRGTREDAAQFTG